MIYRATWIFAKERAHASTSIDLDLAYSELPPPWDHQAEEMSSLIRGSFALYWSPGWVRLGSVWKLYASWTLSAGWTA